MIFVYGVVGGWLLLVAHGVGCSEIFTVAREVGQMRAVLDVRCLLSSMVAVVAAVRDRGNAL